MKMQEIEGLRKRFAEAKQIAYSNGSNVLVVNIEAESQLFKQIKSELQKVSYESWGQNQTFLWSIATLRNSRRDEY